MQVVDITRVNCDSSFESDMLVGRYSMDAKSKTINYICEYALANFNIEIDEELLDSNLDMNSIFSLKKFIQLNYNLDLDKDIIVQSVNANKDNCVFLKKFDNECPLIMQFNKEDISKAKSYLVFLFNDSLISELNFNNKLNDYDKYKLDFGSFNQMKHSYNNVNLEINTLYNDGLFLEELLDNTYSLNYLRNRDGININI